MNVIINQKCVVEGFCEESFGKGLVLFQEESVRGNILIVPSVKISF